ncbi:uncharacterized protein LOC117218888 isoform X2 [Megalopta genalis]|uniref:uncharacterized protein LOC117218888 isoform X2 n=1 Tax=Megalopta genalis TaxID=115081 RepID=UPI003FD0B679
MSACDVHYKFSVRLMRILGLWPYDSESTRRIRATLVNIFCSLMIIVQITPFITGDFDFMLLLQALPITIISLGSVVKFNAFLFMTSAIKQLMESIQAKWNTTHKDTLEILERRATLGKQQGAIYAIIHQCISFFLITTIYVATETLFIMWLQHSISLYEIVCYNIEKGIAAAPSYITEKLMNTYRSDYIAKAVNYHADAKVFMMFLKGKVVFSYAVLLLFAVVSLSINLFRLSIAICETHDIQEMVMAMFFTTSELVYMFYLNYIIQHLLDYADSLSTFTYSTPWYNTSVFTQKQLLLIITRCNEALIFDLYGFFNASIEGFSGLVRCTMSYFMMLTSMQ